MNKWNREISSSEQWKNTGNYVLERRIRSSYSSTELKITRQLIWIKDTHTHTQREREREREREERESYLPIVVLNYFFSFYFRICDPTENTAYIQKTIASITMPQTSLFQTMPFFHSRFTMSGMYSLMRKRHQIKPESNWLFP